MNESEKQFSFTHAAPSTSTSGRAKKQSLISNSRIFIVSLFALLVWRVTGFEQVRIAVNATLDPLLWQPRTRRHERLIRMHKPSFGAASGLCRPAAPGWQGRALAILSGWGDSEVHYAQTTEQGTGRLCPTTK